MSDRILVFEIYEGEALIETKRLRRDIVKIGSLPTSHLKLDDPAVSGIHAVIEVSGDSFQCIDLGSAAGTRVNGERINKRELNPGDVLEFGSLKVIFQVEARATYAGANAKKFRYVQLVDRPSDTRHYARRFLAQPSRADGTVEIAHLWRDHVMSEITFRDKRKAVTIGKDVKNDIVLEDTSIPDDRFELLRRGANGDAFLVLTPGMKGEVYIEAEKLTIAEAMRQGKEGVRITKKTRARLFFGESTIYVHQGTKPDLALPFGGMEFHVAAFTVISMLLHGVLLGLVWLSPQGAQDLSLDGFSLDESIVSVSQLEEEPEPDEIPEILELENNDEDELAAQEAGESGRAGEEDEVEENRRMAVEGPEDNTQVTLSRREAEEQAEDLSALAVLREFNSPSSLFGDTPSGYDDVSAIGAVYGDTVGSARGFGGLGVSGSGFSAGGNNPGGFGIGAISTRGMYGQEDDNSRNLARGLRDRGGVDIEVDLGRPSIEGHLDRAIIQRVIRQNRRAIRDCYQSALQRNSSLEGRIMVSFTIDPAGIVAAAEVTETEMNSSAVEDCLEARIRRIRFPEPSTPGLVHVNYPFVFTGGG